MKRNYYIFIIIFLVVLFRTSILNLFMNVKKMFTNAEPNIEIVTLKEENRRLKDEYTSLLDFKSRINIDEDYTITNVHKSNYGFDKIVLNGSFKENSEIVSDDGLVGIITKSDNNLSYGEFHELYKKEGGQMGIQTIKNWLKGRNISTRNYKNDL